MVNNYLQWWLDRPLVCGSSRCRPGGHGWLSWPSVGVGQCLHAGLSPPSVPVGAGSECCPVAPPTHIRYRHVISAFYI